MVLAMNVSAAIRILWCLKRSFHQKQYLLPPLLKIQCVPNTDQLKSISFSHCHNAILNQKILLENESIWKKGWKKIKFYIIDRSKMKVCGYYLYETIADKIDYMKFFEEMKLPDTFNSWFLVTELHLWMLMVRSMDLGTDGRNISYYMVESMWRDVAMKGQKLGPEHRSKVMEQIRELGDQFHAALLAYDEGLLTDDKILASALWRRFFEMNCNDAKKVETMVKYVRQQILYLEGLTEEQFRARKINWLPLEIT